MSDLIDIFIQYYPFTSLWFVAISINNIMEIRTVIWDLFYTNRKSKTAAKIMKSQSVINKISLGFTLLYCKKNRQPLKFWLKFYKVYLIICAVIFLLYVLSLMLLYGGKLFMIILVICTITNTLITLWFRLYFNRHDGDRSKYSVKK